VAIRRSNALTMMSRGPTKVVAMGQGGDDRSAERAAAPADPALARRLTAGQLESLRPYGEVRGTVAGQMLFREGDRSYDFIVILAGSVKVLDHEAGEQRELVVVRDAMGGRRTLEAAALFVLIGAEPRAGWVGGAVGLARYGSILPGAGLGSAAERRPPWDGVKRSPYLLETSLPGVFAAGDVRSGSVKRVASAVGEGSIAAHFAGEHL